MLYDTGLGQYTGFADYISAMEKKNQGFSKNLTQDDENCLKRVLVKANDLEGKQDYPYLAKAVTVEGGASIVTIPLERLYCRVYFSFLLTGNTTDNITINTIMLGGTVNSGYLFLEREAAAKSNMQTWSSDFSSDVFTNTSGTEVSQPLHPGGTMLTLCNNSDHSPIYFRSYQYLRDSPTNAPGIWLTITSKSDEGQKIRILKAPLYSISGMDGKFYYGFMRNHTYHVISTINASTLKLENVTVQMHDWIDRGEVDIPGFE